MRWRKRVEAFLYSIPRLEIAVKNLKEAIENIDFQLNSLPSATTSQQGKVIRDGWYRDKIADWAAKKDVLLERRKYIEAMLVEKSRKLASYRRVLSRLGQENKSYPIIIQKKYCLGAKDSIIRDMYLFVSKPTYYRWLNYCLKIFYECMPEEFETFVIPKNTKQEL